ncbi:MAG: RadC family protein [Oscillospiraceae bacterium]|nr:RadC family protein [Oscillospiraceae bacterium]
MDRPDKKSSRAGHRARLRSRFAAEGADALTERELTELLLFYAIPQKDTAPIADSLLAHFGSIDGILSAPEQALAEVPGMTPGAAVLIPLLRQLWFRSTLERVRGCTIRSMHHAAAVFRTLSRFADCTQVWALLLDGGMKLRDCIPLCGRSAVSPEPAALAAMTALPGGIFLLAHQQPEGTVLPTTEDIALTRRAFEMLKQRQITVHDHLVITDTDCFSMRANGQFSMLYPI